MTIIDPYENPDNVPDEVAAVVEDAAPEYTDLNLQRRFRIYAGIGVAVALLLVFLVIRVTTRGGELDSLRKRNETLTNTNESQQLLIDKLATQLDEARAQGAAVPTPEVVAEETPGAEVSPVEGPAGERGEAGLPGEAGVGTTGAPGSVGSSGSKGEPGDTGDTGTAGTPGAPGSTGADGASIQGPPGPAGVDGQPGADGAPGQPGADGAQGPPGPGPSDQQIADAVAAYCSVPGNCTVIP